MNSPLFPCVQHAQGSSHEWHSLSRLNRCYSFLGPLAFAWLWGTADELSQRMNENDQRIAEQIPNGALRVGFVSLVDSAPLVMAQENPNETQPIKEPFSVTP